MGMSDALNDLETAARLATPVNCPSTEIDPENPYWGPRLRTFQEACRPETVLKLIAVARAADALVAPLNDPPLAECHCMECPCVCWQYDLAKRRQVVRDAIAALVG